MSEYKEKEKKGGFGALLSSLFGRGTSASGGAAGLGSAGSGFGSASGFGGLFASKAGVMGIILGGATIAAGIGVIYNFVGPFSRSAYTPQLFQDTYYEEQSRNASLERAKQKEDSAASASTLDMFREQAQRAGLVAEGDAAGETKEASAEDAAAGGQAAADPAAGASAEAPANAPEGGGARLKAGAGFGGSGGGASSKISGVGAMFGGVNGQAVPGSRLPAGQNAQGKSSSMKGSMSSAVRSSPKRVVSNYNRKSAFGQAQFTRAQGVRAAGLTNASASRTTATEAFSGETAADLGDIGTPGGGVGLGGAGISSGNKFRGSDPSLNLNQSTPPAVPPVDVSPWKQYTDLAVYGMIAGSLLVMISSWLANKAKMLVAGGPIGALAASTWYTAASIAAYAAMAAAAVVIYAGFVLMNTYGQTWTGVMYMAAGAMIIYSAYKALAGVQNGKLDADKIAKTVRADSAANNGINTKLTANVPGTTDTSVTFKNGVTKVYNSGGGLVGAPPAPPPGQSIASISDIGYGSNMDSLI